MNLSGSLTELATALRAAQSEFTNVPKRATNPFFKSKYATQDDLQAMADPILAKHGLAVIHSPSIVDGSPALATMLLHTSGEWLADVMLLRAAKDDPQGQGAAITYARRYAYSAILGLITDDDDDGEAAMARPKAQAPRRTVTLPTTAPSAATPTVTPTMESTAPVEIGWPVVDTPEDIGASTRVRKQTPKQTAQRSRVLSQAEIAEASSEGQLMLAGKPTQKQNNLFWALWKGSAANKAGEDVHEWVGDRLDKPVHSITQLDGLEMASMIDTMKGLTGGVG
jgi:hypothetical protein